MAKERGFWSLDVDVEIKEIDMEHIAEMIKAGFTSGEIVESE